MAVKGLIGVPRFLTAKLLLVAVLAGWLLMPGPARGQAEELSVTIDWPNEGESLYAGPSSLLYKAPVRGRVSGGLSEMETLRVDLEIYSQNQLMGMLTTIPEADGSFEFWVTVNPHGPVEQFEIAFIECGVACHSQGELALPEGPVRLRATVRDQAGGQVSVERRFVIDISGQAIIPVRVVDESNPSQVVANVTVSASTRLYQWRARFGSARSDASGLALIPVEALSQAPTEYLLKVDPVVVDGRLVSGTKTVRVTLPPGGGEVDPVTLTVTSQDGRIVGRVTSPTTTSPSTQKVWAISLPSGQATQAEVDAEGGFEFSGMALNRYRLALDGRDSLTDGVSCPWRDLDLVASPESSVVLTMDSLPGNSVTGRVTAEEGALPFAWASSESAHLSQAVRPGLDRFVLTGLPSDTTTVEVGAPGYYSQAQEIEVPAAGEGGMIFTLKRQEETETRPWGAGHVVVPAQSRVSDDGTSLSLERGWLWGQNPVAKPLTLRVASVTLSLASGRFALEMLPGKSGWFYLSEGQATAQRPGDPEPTILEAGQMINVLAGTELQAVALDPVVVAALHGDEDTPIAHRWESSPQDRVRGALAGIGLGAAQVITFITYFLVFLSIILTPALVLYSWYRRRQKGDS